MNTILTDDEIHKWWASENGMEDADMAKLTDFREVTRKVEAAVLAKLREQEPPYLRQLLMEVVCLTYRPDLQVQASELLAAPLPAVVQVPQDAISKARYALAMLIDPEKLEPWQTELYDRTRDALLAAAPEAPATADEWLPLTPEEQNRLDELLKHTRWLMQSMPAMDGLQHSWALNARQAMQRMHDWLRMYLPPATPCASEAPATAVVQVPQGWRLEVDESAIYHNDKRIAVLEEDGGNQSWRDACALGQQIVDRMNAAHEAPAQADPMEKLTRIQEELGLYDDQPAQPIPAPWREAVKVAREALIAAEQDSADFQRVNVDEIRAALAQLDSLGGGE